MASPELRAAAQVIPAIMCLPAPGRVAGCTDLPPGPGGARFYDRL